MDVLPNLSKLLDNFFNNHLTMGLMFRFNSSIMYLMYLIDNLGIEETRLESYWKLAILTCMMFSMASVRPNLGRSEGITLLATLLGGFLE